MWPSSEIWEYLTYRPKDLLMFSERVYYRMFEQYNQDIWPAQLLALGFGLLILFLILRPGLASGRVISAILGVIWLWVGWAFLWERFAVINWPVSYVAAFFLVEGALFIGAGAVFGRLNFAGKPGWPRPAASALFVLALLYPLVAPVAGRSWAAGEYFGLAPDPTAIGTLALLALVSGGGAWLLMIVPLFWCAISGLTLWTMGSAEFILPLAGAVLAVAIAIANRTGSPEQTPAQG